MCIQFFLFTFQNKYWVEKKLYLHYSPPPLQNSSSSLLPGALEAWLENMDFIKTDLEELLNESHNR